MAIDPNILIGASGGSILGVFYLIWRMYNKAVEEVKLVYEKQIESYRDILDRYDVEKIQKWMDFFKQRAEEEKQELSKKIIELEQDRQLNATDANALIDESIRNLSKDFIYWDALKPKLAEYTTSSPFSIKTKLTKD